MLAEQDIYIEKIYGKGTDTHTDRQTDRHADISTSNIQHFHPNPASLSPFQLFQQNSSLVQPILAYSSLLQPNQNIHIFIKFLIFLMFLIFKMFIMFIMFKRFIMFILFIMFIMFIMFTMLLFSQPIIPAYYSSLLFQPIQAQSILFQPIPPHSQTCKKTTFLHKHGFSQKKFTQKSA